ncbi:MAG: UDP-glucuronic acid decarboxylase family protein [bacterium]
MSVCLITGGAGFIGSHLCEYLLNEGNRVVCVDNFITGSEDNISQLITSKDFRLVNSNVCDLKLDDEPTVDFIYHLASPASPKDFLPLSIEILSVGSIGTLNMLSIAQQHNAKILIASSSEVYGDPYEHPQKETYWGNCNPIGIRGVYDESKRFSEACAMAFYRRYKTQIRIARIFNTYGPRMRRSDGRVIPNFITQALDHKPLTIYGDGSQMRSFCYISDMVDGLVKLMESDYIKPVNLGNPNEISVKDVAIIICEIVGIKSEFDYLPLPEDDPKRRLPDIEIAKNLLNWAPKFDLMNGLKKTIEYFSNL